MQDPVSPPAGPPGTESSNGVHPYSAPVFSSLLFSGPERIDWYKSRLEFTGRDAL